MKRQTLPLAFKRTILLLSVIGISAIAMAQELPIRRGLYVANSFKCADAPNAAIAIWDGAGFSGAHSSKCISHVTAAPGGTYQIKTACSALGDGSPNANEAAFDETITLKRFSSTKFIVTKTTGVTVQYRWCRAK